MRHTLRIRHLLLLALLVGPGCTYRCYLYRTGPEAHSTRNTPLRVGIHRFSISNLENSFIAYSFYPSPIPQYVSFEADQREVEEHLTRVFTEKLLRSQHFASVETNPFDESDVDLILRGKITSFVIDSNFDYEWKIFLASFLYAGYVLPMHRFTVKFAVTVEAWDRQGRKLGEWESKVANTDKEMWYDRVGRYTGFPIPANSSINTAYASLIAQIIEARHVERLEPGPSATAEAKPPRPEPSREPPAAVPPVTPAPSAEAPAPIVQRWAVIVGVSEYKHAGVGGLTNLRYAARDAQRLYDQLVSSSPATWPKENIRLLTNKDATERAVREALLIFLKKAQKDDLVLIFFSGHGTPDPARPQNSYFLCYDTNPEQLTTTGFPMWEIDNALERGIIEARRVAVLADACHSGGFAPEGMRDIRVVSRNVSEGMQALAKKAACRVVTSCEPGELSQEKADWGEGHGAFAYALIKGLAGAADSAGERNARGNGDGKVDLDELVYYLRREVGDLTSNGQHVQDAGRLNAVLMGK